MATMSVGKILLAAVNRLPTSSRSWFRLVRRCKSSKGSWRYAEGTPDGGGGATVVRGQEYPEDSMTNVTERILSYLERKIHLVPDHPLNLIQRRIVDYMYRRYPGSSSSSSPLFSVHSDLSPVVTLEANFDSLLVPDGHPSRRRSDSYYLNGRHMLRAHTSAHQSELIRMGLNNFMVVGDVYRRDTIDATHHPVFHQIEGVRLLGRHEMATVPFESGRRTADKQQFHTAEAVRIVETDLKDCLLGLTRDLFGKDIEYKWVDCYFPFTHPSWELEIFYNDRWMEVLGCGIVEQEILHGAGAGDQIGYAFGLGLERLAMKLYRIPDIRLFWSQDPRFLNQFRGLDLAAEVVYKEMSKHPPCANDISFWLPPDVTPSSSYSENDFYDLVRTVGGDVVEQVEFVDEFVHPEKRRTSHCYKITYRHMEKTLTQREVNKIHSEIEEAAKTLLKVEIR